MNCELYNAECVSVSGLHGTRKRKVQLAGDSSDHTVSVDDKDVSSGATLSAPLETPGCMSFQLEDTDPFRIARNSHTHQEPSRELSTSVQHTDPPPYFDQGINNMDSGLPLDFWSFDSLLASYGLLDDPITTESLFPSGAPATNQTDTVLHPSPHSLANLSQDRTLTASEPAPERSCSLDTDSHGIFNRKEGENSHFLGSYACIYAHYADTITGQTSTAAVLAFCVRESRRVHDRLQDYESLHFIIECGPVCDEISPTDLLLRELPQSAAAAQLVEGDFFALFYETMT